MNCAGQSYHGRFGFSECGNSATVEHEGKWYCKIHHPMMKEDRRKEADRKASDRWKLKTDGIVRSYQAVAACRGVEVLKPRMLADAIDLLKRVTVDVDPDLLVDIANFLGEEQHGNHTG